MRAAASIASLTSSVVAPKWAGTKLKCHPIKKDKRVKIKNSNIRLQRRKERKSLKIVIGHSKRLREMNLTVRGYTMDHKKTQPWDITGLTSSA